MVNKSSQKISEKKNFKEKKSRQLAKIKSDLQIAFDQVKEIQKSKSKKQSLDNFLDHLNA